MKPIGEVRSIVLEMVGRRNSAFKNIHETGGTEHASTVPVGFVTTLVTGEVCVLLAVGHSWQVRLLVVCMRTFSVS